MKSLPLCLLLAAAGMALSLSPAAGATWRIRADGTGDAPTIAAAVALAASGDSLRVYPGTYLEHDITVAKQLFIVSTDGERTTIVDAGSLGRCFVFPTFTLKSTVRGFTLRDGTGRFDPVYTGFGGAILCRSRAQVDLVDCTFRNNTANLGGAALVRDSSAVAFQRCKFLDNSAYVDNYPGTGGALELLGTLASYSALSVVIDSCLFVNNTAQLDGGAVSIAFCTPSILHSTFYGNDAQADGGAISIGDGGLDLAYSIVSHSGSHGIVTFYTYLGGTWTANDFYANASGNYGGIIPDQTGINWNISADPLYCDAPGDLSISTTSPCAASNNPSQQTIGRYGPFCGPNLVIAGVDWSGTSPPLGTPLSGTVKVKNTGTKSAGPFYVDYYRDLGGPPPTGHPGSERHLFAAGLAAGDSALWTTTAVTTPYFDEWQSYFRVDTDLEVPETSESDNLGGPYTITWPVPGQPGWPTVGSAFRSSPAIAPLDGDARTQEVIVGDEGGQLHAWTPAGVEVHGFPVVLGGPIRSSPAVGDVNGDRSNEIVVGCDDGRLYAVSPEGEVLWRYALGQPVQTTPTLVDLDSDGVLDILCPHRDAIHALNGEGRPLEGWPFVVEDAKFANCAAGDVDRDGGPEVAAVARIGESVSRVYLLDQLGKLYSDDWPVQLDELIESGPALGNVLTAREDLEIVAGALSGRVYVLDARGRVWTTIPQVNGEVSSSPILVDLTWNGPLDIVVSSKAYQWGGVPPSMGWDGYLTGIDRFGGVIPGWPATPGRWPTDVGPVPSAIALGGPTIVLVGSPYNHVFAWQGEGDRNDCFPIYLGASVVASAAAGDVDGDGWIEVFVPTMGGQVHGLELRSPRYTDQTLWWPMFGHDRARTHCYGYLVPSATEDGGGTVPIATMIGAVHPNPFGATTRIAFALARRGPAELSIYDVTGHRIAVLVDGELEAGHHEISWNGTLAGTRQVPPGVYFCQLRSDARVMSRKIVRLP